MQKIILSTPRFYHKAISITIFLSLFLALQPNILAQSEDKIYKFPDEKPEFQGGFTALNQYLATNIKYPNAARENEIEGKVFLQFVVEKDGSLSSVTVLRGIGFCCDEEAVRTVKSMPKWKAGKVKGMFVRCAFSLPIMYSLGGVLPHKEELRRVKKADGTTTFERVKQECTD
jgi:TonB family protein